MDLIQKPDPVVWPETHYIFIEKIGSFQKNAPQAWQELHQSVGQIADQNKITGFLSLYKIDPARMVYRAGVSVAMPPTKWPPGFAYEKFPGGKYICYVLTGSYAQLPEASGRVFEMFAQKKFQKRDDFHIENYVNDPKTTPEAQLITQILVPVV